MSEPPHSPQRLASPDEPVAQSRRLQPLAGPNWQAWERFKGNHGALFGGCFLILFLLVIALWPFLSPYQANAISDLQFGAPSWHHWFGTDVHGRDLFTRVAYGARISLLVGATGAAVSLAIGVLWGAVAGYAGGRWDSALMRTVDILYALPTIVFVIVVLTALNGLLENWETHGLPGWAIQPLRMLGLFGGLGAVSWLTMARIVRGQVLSLRSRPFVEASIALGATHTRVLLRSILPNLSGIIIVYLALSVPGIVLYESFLSYLGMGIQPPQASLGSLLAEGAEQINSVQVYWWVILFPAATLALTLLALNFVGDGLRDALDPRVRRQ